MLRRWPRPIGLKLEVEHISGRRCSTSKQGELSNQDLNFWSRIEISVLAQSTAAWASRRSSRISFPDPRVIEFRTDASFSAPVNGPIALFYSSRTLRRAKRQHPAEKPSSMREGEHQVWTAKAHNCNTVVMAALGLGNVALSVELYRLTRARRTSAFASSRP
jgi:hypothetical protein